MRSVSPLLLIVFGICLAFVGSACQPTTKPERVAVGSPGTPGHSDAPLRFTDRAAEAGLHYRWTIAGKRPLTILQTIGNGCAFLDYDNDGNLDILLVGPRVALYRGDGRGHFTHVSEASGLGSLHGDFRGCAVGDYDNDGFPDIYLSAHQGGALLHNVRGRRFEDVSRNAGIPTQPWGSACAFGDVNGDGRLDLFIGNYVEFGPKTDPQLCDFNGVPSSCNPRSYRGLRGRLYINRGQGRFQDVSREWGMDQTAGKVLGAAFADFDSSGRQSLTLANDGEPGDLLRNVGGRFESVGAVAGTALDRDGRTHAGMGTVWGDYDNDGQLDLAVATFQRETKTIYHNDHGLFSERAADLGITAASQSLLSFGVRWADFDNDGWLDLMLTNGHVQDNIDRIDAGTTYRQPTLLFHNEGAHGAVRFETVRGAGNALDRPIVGRGLAIGDYDNDGGIDALIVDSEGAPLLLHNETPQPGNYLMLRLIGTRSNRMGLGALVEAKTDDRTISRHCATDGSYLSASDARVHFGLGKATSVQITVHWPSGRTEIFAPAVINRTLSLTEGTGKPAGSHPEHTGVNERIRQ